MRKAIICFVLFVYTLSLFADDGQKYVNIGKEHLKEGNYQFAVDSFIDALIADPKNKEAQKLLNEVTIQLQKKCDKFSIAVEAYQSKNYDIAIDRLIELLEKNPKNKEAVALVIKINNDLIRRFKKEAKKALKKQQKEIARKKKEMKPLYNEAKKYYKMKWCLSATDKLSEILLKYPEYQQAKNYYEKIKTSMRDTVKIEQTADLEEFSYARGYVFYYEQKFSEAINEWNKVLRINPNRDELNEYVKNVNAYLKNTERLDREKKIEEKVQRLFAEGVLRFDRKSWVVSIKKMENVQDICRAQPFPKSLDWHDKAQEYIIKAVDELSKVIAKKPDNKFVSSTPVEQSETDLAGADKKYSEGLVLYAQGKLSDASQQWEIAIRMNPGHEKARRALERVRNELQSQKK